LQHFHAGLQVDPRDFASLAGQAKAEAALGQLGRWWTTGPWSARCRSRSTCWNSVSSSSPSTTRTRPGSTPCSAPRSSCSPRTASPWTPNRPCSRPTTAPRRSPAVRRRRLAGPAVSGDGRCLQLGGVRQRALPGGVGLGGQGRRDRLAQRPVPVPPRHDRKSAGRSAAARTDLHAALTLNPHFNSLQTPVAQHALTALQ